MKSKLQIGVLCGFYFLIIGGSLVFGTFEFVAWFHRFAVRNAPVVSGQVVAREATKRTANFTIQLEGRETKVHARTGSYLIDQVPDSVHFHYSGDPAKEIYLFEIEDNPFWIFLTCWGAVLLIAVVRGRALIALWKLLFA